jgi:hypothetical protein
MGKRILADHQLMWLSSCRCHEFAKYWYPELLLIQVIIYSKRAVLSQVNICKRECKILPGVDRHPLSASEINSHRTLSLIWNLSWYRTGPAVQGDHWTILLKLVQCGIPLQVKFFPTSVAKIMPMPEECACEKNPGFRWKRTTLDTGWDLHVIARPFPSLGHACCSCGLSGYVHSRNRFLSSWRLKHGLPSFQRLRNLIKLRLARICGTARTWSSLWI